MKKILPLLALLLMACGSTPAHQTTSDASSVEEAAVSHLYYVLNSDSGHVMTASELAHQKAVMVFLRSIYLLTKVMNCRFLKQYTSMM